MSKNEAYIAVAVATAIVDLFKDEEERSPIPKIDTENLKEEGNDLFFALFKAIQIISTEMDLNRILDIDEALGGRIIQAARGNKYIIAKDRGKNYRLKE